MAKRLEKYKDPLHEKDCEYKRRWYEKNKQRVIERSIRDKQELKEWFEDFRATLACVKCGENHPACLDFHHRDPGQKDMEVSTALSWGKKKMLEEIGKCDVLCCKCHRILHWEERNARGGN